MEEEINFDDLLEKGNEKKNVLIESLEKDKDLDSETRLEYIGMANIFLASLSENIYKTSIELNEKHTLGVDTWREFLNYPKVRKYIKTFKDEQMQVRADEGLVTGDKSAYNLKKVIDSQGPAVNNSNIILIRLPEKREWD